VSVRGWRTVATATALVLLAVATARVTSARADAESMTLTAPERLSETGLYTDAESLTVDPLNRPFTPQYPLWSDGASKRRWVRLPEGTTIDVTNLDHWEFPVGTKFWKEFQFGGRRVETRFLWKVSPTRWEFASYVWSDDLREAVRASQDGIVGVREVAPGKSHSIPSAQECHDCHDSSRTEVLGFGALQLSTDRDPLAPHAEAPTADMVTLRTLVEEGRLRPSRPDLVARPPRIQAADPRERAALGYLSANCGSCHNAESSIASLGLFLRHRLEADPLTTPDAIATSRNHIGHWEVPTAPPGRSRILHPGRPDLSAIVYRARSRRPSSQMPPIGTVMPDADGVALLSSWIASDGDSAATSHESADSTP